MNRLIRQDVLAGLLFLTFGVLALAFSTDLRVGTAGRMGPGYVPRLLAWVLIALGLIVAARGWVRRGAPPGIVLHLRPIALVTLAILTLALTFAWGGMLPGMLAMIAIAAMASPESRLRETVALAVLLSAFGIAAFKYGLGMPFPVIRGVW